MQAFSQKGVQVAKYLFPNRFIYGAVLSLWTQRLMSIHDIQSLPFTPSIHHGLQRLDRGILVKHCSVEPKDGSSSPRIANNLLPYLWILDNLFGRRTKIASRGVFHQAFSQWFSLTKFISYWNPCIWLAESKLVSEKHWQKAWWNAPQVPLGHPNVYFGYPYFFV